LEVKDLNMQQEIIYILLTPKKVRKILLLDIMVMELNMEILEDMAKL